VGAADVVDIGTLVETFAVQFRSRVSVATAIAKDSKRPLVPRIDPSSREEKKAAPKTGLFPVKNDSWADESDTEYFVKVQKPPAPAAMSAPKLEKKPPDK